MMLFTFVIDSWHYGRESLSLLLALGGRMPFDVLRCSIHCIPLSMGAVFQKCVLARLSVLFQEPAFVRG